MGNVKIEHEVNGEKVTRIIARHIDVQAELKAQALSYALKAEALLGEHRSDRKGGHSSIRTARGDIDHYVVLDDTNGDSAAAAIEYGRVGKVNLLRNGKGFRTGGSKGLFILHRAFGLEH